MNATNATLDMSPAEYARRLAAGEYADNKFRFRRALHGFDPAEVLSPTDRAQLMRLCVSYWGWTDLQVAARTRWSYPVVVRIRERLLLAANTDPKGA